MTRKQYCKAISKIKPDPAFLQHTAHRLAALQPAAEGLPDLQIEMHSLQPDEEDLPQQQRKLCCRRLPFAAAAACLSGLLILCAVLILPRLSWNAGGKDGPIMHIPAESQPHETQTPLRHTPALHHTPAEGASESPVLTSPIAEPTKMPEVTTAPPFGVMFTDFLTPLALNQPAGPDTDTNIDLYYLLADNGMLTLYGVRHGVTQITAPDHLLRFQTNLPADTIYVLPSGEITYILVNQYIPADTVPACADTAADAGDIYQASVWYYLPGSGWICAFQTSSDRILTPEDIRGGDG